MKKSSQLVVVVERAAAVGGLSRAPGLGARLGGGLSWTRRVVSNFFFFFFFFFCYFFGLLLRHMEVPRLGVESEL